jgi:hypothetical protein
LQLRLAATAINTVAALGALALTIAAGVLAYGRFAKRRSEPDGPLHAISDDPGAEPVRAGRQFDWQRFAEALQTRPVKLGLQVLALAATLRRHERRSLGFCLLGLRLVDAHSGGELAPRQRLARAIARRLWQALHQWLLPVRTPQPPLDQEKVRSEMAAARSAHADDRQALQQAMMQVYRENRVQTRVSCFPAIARLPLIAAIDIPMPWSPLAQSLVDWLSGTVVVVDRRDRKRAHGPRRHGRRTRRSISRA